MLGQKGRYRGVKTKQEVEVGGTWGLRSTEEETTCYRDQTNSRRVKKPIKEKVLVRILVENRLSWNSPAHGL